MLWGMQEGSGMLFFFNPILVDILENWITTLWLKLIFDWVMTLCLFSNSICGPSSRNSFSGESESLIFSLSLLVFHCNCKEPRRSGNILSILPVQSGGLRSLWERPRSPELCWRSARRLLCVGRPAASSGRCVPSPASSCGSTETAAGPGSPPETAGSARPCARQTGGSCSNTNRTDREDWIGLRGWKLPSTSLI